MRRPTKMGETGMFSGLAYCADCGAKLYHCRAAVWTHEQECYTCANYRIRKQCSAHYIRAAVLKRMVLQNLQRVVACVHEDEDGLAWRVMESKTTAQRVDYGQAERGTVCEAVRGLRAGTDGLETVRCSLRTIVYAAETGRQCSALSENREEVHRAHQADSGNPAGVCGEDGGSRPGKSSGYRVQRIAVHYTLIGEIDLLPEYSKYEKKQPHDALASCGCLPPGKLLYQCSSDGAALVFGQAFHRLRQPRGSLGPLPVLRQGVRFPGTPIPPSGA